jgi:hypothetical protein
MNREVRLRNLRGKVLLVEVLGVNAESAEIAREYVAK